jgi:diguanylate cyclase (GGDEF)-like protein/PAS domain S-box-containing protein
MGWIKEGIKFLISRSSKEQKEFEQQNSQLVLGRIRLISLATICFSLFWLYMDYTFLKNGSDRSYVITLVFGHIISVVVSAVILIFYKKLNSMKQNEKYPKFYCILKLYVFLYILMGVISSVNSQRHTGNIYSYIILSLITATALALKPSYMLFAYGVNHIIFLIGIWSFNNDINLFLVKLVNATGLIIAAFLLSFIFYRHRMIEFLYRKELMENEENFKKLFYVNPYPVFILRMDDGKIIEANKRACDLLEIDSTELPSSNEIDGFINKDSIHALQEELMKHNSTYNRIVEYDFKGKHMWVKANYELIDYHGEKCILTGIMDITEIRKAEEELNHYASTDTLTGIMNRRMGMKKLEELLAESKEDYLEFVLCFLDLNNLKNINDTYGHGEGDRFILTFCEIINRCLQDEDLFFRMGGDEFIIIFKDKNKSQAEKKWSEIQKQFDESDQKGEAPYCIMASHGLAYYQSGMDIDIEYIIEKADKQMYKEKQRFRKEYPTKH